MPTTSSGGSSEGLDFSCKAALVTTVWDLSGPPRAPQRMESSGVARDDHVRPPGPACPSWSGSSGLAAILPADLLLWAPSCAVGRSWGLAEPFICFTLGWVGCSAVAGGHPVSWLPVPAALNCVCFVVVVIVLSLCHVYFLQPRGLQHTRLLCPPLSPGVCSDSYSLSR